MGFDTIIRGGKVIDGSGAAAFVADVGIEGDTVRAVGDLQGAEAATIIDGRGRWVTPGFIDAHAHSDVALFHNPTCESQVAQGITTEVMGNCGYSPFPLLGNNAGYLLDPKGVDTPWRSAHEYFERVIAGGMGINAVPQVGHITVRAAVLDRSDRPATPDEIERMKGHVADAMAAGARGISSGLDYDPSTVSDLEEMVELAEVVKAFGGFYTSHIRGYSRNVINAVAEALEVGRRTGVPVQISHLNVFGRGNWGKGQRVLEIIAKARAEGVQVASDMMTYTTSGAWWSPRAIFPPSDYDWKRPYAENLPTLRAKLADPLQRARLKGEVEARRVRPKYGFHEEFAIFSTWSDIYIEELDPSSPHRHLLGLDMARAAEADGREPCDLYFDLLLEEGETFAAICMPVSPSDFKAFMADAGMMFGTDAIGTSIARLREPWNTIQPHPRHYGTFPRVLATYVRDRGELQLEDAVRRMSGLPADHFGLRGRGYLRPGNKADVVVVNPESLAEGASWGKPTGYPHGIEHVWVNGAAAVALGRITGKLAGEMLAGGSSA
jgi:N-acyl-D-aspartate/D-glutamate deacylase